MLVESRACHPSETSRLKVDYKAEGCRPALQKTRIEVLWTASFLRKTTTSPTIGDLASKIQSFILACELATFDIASYRKKSRWKDLVAIRKR